MRANRTSWAGAHLIYYMEIVEVRDKPTLGPDSTTLFEYEIKHKVTPIFLIRTEPIWFLSMLWKCTVVLYMLLVWQSYVKGVCMIMHT